MSIQVIVMLAQYARSRPGHPAFVQVTPLCAGSRSTTYAQLERSVRFIANEVAVRTTPGDVVMLCSRNRPEFVAAYLGVLAAGRSVFPVHPTIVHRELADAARRSRARVFIGTSDRIAAIANLNIESIDLLRATADAGHGTSSSAKMPIDGVAMLLQSSGTTGSPKIVRRTGGSLHAVARNVAAAVGLTSEDRVLAAIPLCHSYGVENGLLAPLLSGSTVYLCDGFDPAVVSRCLAQERISVFPGTPFMFEMLAGTLGGEGARSLRSAYSAGAALPPSVAESFGHRTGKVIGQLYGSTEVGSVAFADPLRDDFEPGTVGRPMHDVHIRILDPEKSSIGRALPMGEEGHVAITSPSALERYVDDPQPAMAEDGYFLTGDLGRITERGNLAITGRIKLQIDIGGLKINPAEIEHVLMQHPLVGECVVVPIRLTETLDRLRAIVTPRDRHRPPSVGDLRQFARTRLSQHKVPRTFEVRDSLPRSPSGKILRGRLQCAC